jgi:hypothetical protein
MVVYLLIICIGLMVLVCMATMGLGIWEFIPWKSLKVWGVYRIQRIQNPGAELAFYRLEHRMFGVWVKLTWSVEYDAVYKYLQRNYMKDKIKASVKTVFEYQD